MARIKYEDWTPKGETLQVIAQAEQIARDYQRQGYDLTLRQLYYQFVSRALIPNTDRSYTRLGSIVNNARMAGLLDWSYIVDRTRSIKGIGYYQDPATTILQVADYHTVDHWVDQDFYVEVWVEKEALAGVIERAAGRWDVPFFSCRGYVSQSELWAAGRRLGAKVAEGKSVVILHLGDHDPSGIDMTRDIMDRIQTFTMQDFLNAYPEECGGQEEDGVVTTGAAAIRAAMANRTNRPDLWPIEVRRIALNMEQVEEYNPPPNPAKMTDSRVDSYIREYGNESWELDALEPQVLDDLITSHIEDLIDHDAWEDHDREQEAERDRLRYAAARWPDLCAQYDAEQGL